jgi:hypothetical protein
MFLTILHDMIASMMVRLARALSSVKPVLKWMMPSASNLPIRPSIMVPTAGSSHAATTTATAESFWSLQ